MLDWDSDGDGFSDGEEVRESADPDDPMSKPGLIPMEAGEVTVDGAWQTVRLRRSYAHPVVVACGVSSNDKSPAVVRIGNVSPNGFEIRVQEWDHLDGGDLPESIGYIS